MVIFFTIVIPVIYFLFISYISSLYRNLYNKIGELEIKIIQLENKLERENNNDK